MSRLDLNRNESIDELLEAILSIKDMEQCRAFFSDLCTMQELKVFSQRLQVAKRLLDGQTYEMIRSEVPVSSSTITRISTELQFGAGGYKSVIDALEEK
ncbi:MAG: TrpR-related protein YerC/YecD [Oscillospiraceae bacterium]|nr:TrpR-related protein YerC/YecD [Oscillospiraceae bacterium]